MNSVTKQVTIDTINKLKKDKNAVVLAHNYQTLDIQKIADFVGDSLQLAQEAKKVEADIIVFCGVQFMAETAKLLNPDTKVLLSHPEAGCPMADMATGSDLAVFKSKYQDPVVVCYVNSSIDVKAECDVCVTSSNAVKIVSTIPEDETIIFVPDRNLGSYINDQLGREMILWQGCCNVHDRMITMADVRRVRHSYPDYTIMVHPECSPSVVKAADRVGSTKQMADYAVDHDNLIFGTEIGLIKQLKDLYPEKNIKPLTAKATCINMKKTSLREVLLTLSEEKNEIILEPAIAERALKSVSKMLELSK